MIENNMENMSEEEFDDLIEHFISRGQDKIELPTFLQVMADLADKKKQREIELSGQVVDGEVIFDSPTPTRKTSKLLKWQQSDSLWNS